jgi:nucleoside-diphosphate-sugar epimerase
MKRIFITGASGCIGHYLAETLIQNTNYELFFLVRNPQKLKFNFCSREGVHLIQGDLSSIEQHRNLLSTVNVAILMATAWGGAEISYEINVNKTISLISLLNSEICEQIIYFSTASILDRHNQLLREAEQFGTDYIKTKYQCYVELRKLALSDRIRTIFPTLVLGGDKHKPYSHISAGLPDIVKWIDLIRWFAADGSFHFIHAQDIAQVVQYLIGHPPNASNKIEPDLVLGNARLTVKEAIKQISFCLNRQVYFSIPLTTWLANFFIKIFNIQMDEWSRFSFQYRHFTYSKVVNPSCLNMVAYYPEIQHIMKSSSLYKR